MVYHAIEDSGYRPMDLVDNAEVGVFVRVIYEEYQLYRTENQLRGGGRVLNGPSSSVANRVSYTLGLKGVIGSGSGNSIIDERFSHLDVALIEDDPVFGGTCLNRGCIPTKMFVVASENARTHDPSYQAKKGIKMIGQSLELSTRANG